MLTAITIAAFLLLLGDIERRSWLYFLQCRLKNKKTHTHNSMRTVRKITYG